jgi:hypothetical protein
LEKKMCHICNHHMVKTIDRLLLAGDSPTSLSLKYNFNVTELTRHQEHLNQKMALVAKPFHDGLHQGMFCQLQSVMEIVLWSVREARKGEDFPLCLRASREFSRLLVLMHKLAAGLHFDPEFIYCLMASPQWDREEDTLLPHAFQAMSATRQTLKENLFAICPDPAPEPNPEPPATATVANQTSPSLNANRNFDPHPEMSARPARRTSKRPATDRPQPIGRRAKNQREISAKLARKTQSARQYNEEYQQCTVCEKSSPKKRENFFQRLFRRWKKSGKLPGNPTSTEDID